MREIKRRGGRGDIIKLINLHVFYHQIKLKSNLRFIRTPWVGGKNWIYGTFML
jgi:hypothetical protein